MTVRNSMIVGDSPLPSRSREQQLFFAGDPTACEVVFEVAETGQRFSLNSRQQPFLLIGRSDDCDFTLDHDELSFRHVYFQLIAGQVYWIDLASRTGTFFDSEKKPSGWLTPGQSVTVGPYTISVVSSTAPEHEIGRFTLPDLLSPNGFDQVPSCDVELNFLNGRPRNTIGAGWKIQQPISLVGNYRRCRMRLDDKSVSRIHCGLLTTPMGLWIADFRGRGGTWVNEQPVRFRLLRQDDEVRIGRFRFAVNYGQSLSRTAEPGNWSWGKGSTHNEATATPPQALVPANQGISEGFVLSLMDRVGSMQQQMAALSQQQIATNQQQMAMMAQMMGNLQQNYHVVVQQELTRIHQITAQIQDLQVQIQRTDQSDSETGNADNESKTPSNLPPAQRHLESHGETVADDEPSAPEAASAVTDSPITNDLEESVIEESVIDEAEPTQPEPVDMADAVFAAGNPIFQVAPQPIDDSVSQSDEELSEETDDPSTDATPSDATPSDTPRRNPSDVQDHARLIERMASLERQRKSRWTRIMSLLSGSGS